MTKRELAIEILTSLWNCDKAKVVANVDRGHGDFVGLMKSPKSHLEEMYQIHLRVQANPKI